jgi:hypothetical protein
MNSESFNIILWLTHNSQAEFTQLKIVHVDTGREVQLNGGSFLVRIYL